MLLSIFQSPLLSSRKTIKLETNTIFRLQMKRSIKSWIMPTVFKPQSDMPNLLLSRAM